MKKGIWKRISAIFLCVCIIAAGFYGCNDDREKEGQSEPINDVGTAPETGVESLFGTDGVKAAGKALMRMFRAIAAGIRNIIIRPGILPVCRA